MKIFSKIWLMCSLLSLTACNSDTPQTTKNDSSTPTLKVDKTPVMVETEPFFNQGQLTPKLLGLCVQFKNLEGANRKAVFEQLAAILPYCPVHIGDQNQSEWDTDNAIQKMTPNDLAELLGQPNEIDTKTIRYHLTADASYSVVFLLDAKGLVFGRNIEANS